MFGGAALRYIFRCPIEQAFMCTSEMREILLPALFGVLSAVAGGRPVRRGSLGQVRRS